jgi:ATP-dependent RNA helicase RhlE
MPFKTMGLADPLVKGILATGYTAPTEIQSQAIPAILDGKDIIGCAQTGTGKTAAFVLPILHRLETVPQKSKKKIPRVLVVTPTRELAVQIEQAVRGYGRYMELKTIAVYGGTRIETQMKALRRGIDVVVATPGRLLDLIQRGVMNLSLIEVLVLDEADRMFDMGFITDIRKIVKEIPDERQTLLFSATMPNAIRKLTESIQKSPVMIQIGQQHNPIETITQHIFPVPKDQKMDLLMHLIEREGMGSVLVFSRTRRGADRICKKLNQNYVEAVAIHSDRTQGQRLKALEGFKRGQYQVMVATDIAARGINIQGISHVVNFDVPAYAEDYIHRIGRTGRATATGDAMTFVSEEEVLDLRKIERFIECKFEPKMAEGFAYTHRVSLEPGPKGNKGGKPSKPGSSQRKRAKAQDAKTPRKFGAKPTYGKSGNSEKSGKESATKKKTSFKRAKKKTSGKSENAYQGNRSASSKPKNMKKSWSKKKRPTRDSKPKNA